jgi:hypothetical protein
MPLITSAGVAAKPVRVFILAGQPNMEGHAKVSTFDDVRKDLNAPELPFVIGVIGVGGAQANPRTLAFREAMAAPAAMPEFKGRVSAVQTAPFWDERLAAVDAKRGKVHQRRWELGNQVKAGKLTREEADRQVKVFEDGLITAEDRALWDRGASNAGYHYLGCAKTFALMGRAFADALLSLPAPPGSTTGLGAEKSK